MVAARATEMPVSASAQGLLVNFEWTLDLPIR